MSRSMERQHKISPTKLSSELTCLSSVCDDSFSACKVRTLGCCSFEAYENYCCLNFIVIGLDVCSNFTLMWRKVRKETYFNKWLEHTNICQKNKKSQHIFISCFRIFSGSVYVTIFGFCSVSVPYMREICSFVNKAQWCCTFLLS